MSSHTKDLWAGTLTRHVLQTILHQLPLYPSICFYSGLHSFWLRFQPKPLDRPSQRLPRRHPFYHRGAPPFYYRAVVETTYPVTDPYSIIRAHKLCPKDTPRVPLPHIKTVFVQRSVYDYNPEVRETYQRLQNFRYQRLPGPACRRLS
jgi:hypothetical protein